MALFEKGNNIGNRFTSENQPKKNGRKPSMYKQLKELTGKKVDYELSKEDYYKTIRFLLERSKGELNKIMADANREDSTTPIWVCNIISAIFTDIRFGRTSTVEMIFDRIFGKAAQPIEGDINANVSGGPGSIQTFNRRSFGLSWTIRKDEWQKIKTYKYQWLLQSK